MLLWLSVIVLAPFDLTTIDSKVLDHLVNKNDIKEYLLYIGEFYLGNNSFYLIKIMLEWVSRGTLNSCFLFIFLSGI